jgi:hypothetical protein
MKLLTLADGYGDSNAVPIWYPKYWKWPKIIELMTKGLDVTNCSRYGAGNEFIVNQLKQQIDSVDVAIVQWAQPNRLDLVLAHSDPLFWSDVISSDPIYKNNVVLSGADQFWISSASKTAPLQEYHQKYITKRQHKLRSQVFIEYAKLLLESRDIDYRFMLVEDGNYIDIEAKWICHEPFKGMNDFRYKSKYQDLELGIIQPIPLVAFDFIKQYVMPSIDLHWRTNREIDAVENMLHRHYQEAVANKKQYDSN